MVAEESQHLVSMTAMHGLIIVFMHTTSCRDVHVWVLGKEAQQVLSRLASRLAVHTTSAKSYVITIDIFYGQLSITI